MKRLEEAQASLITTYSLYNAASEKKLPAIDANDTETLKTLLEVIQNRSLYKSVVINLLSQVLKDLLNSKI